MGSGTHGGIHPVREDMNPPASRKFTVDHLHIGKSTAQHDHVGIQHIDDAGKTAGQAVEPSLHHYDRAGVAFVGELEDRAGINRPGTFCA